MYVQKSHSTNNLTVTPNLSQASHNRYFNKLNEPYSPRISSIIIEEHDATTLKNSGLWNKLIQQNRQLHFQVIPDQRFAANEHSKDGLETAIKHQIFTHIAHEINTPLAGITGLIHLLDRDPDPEILDGEMWEMLKKSVHRINHTIANILLYEQIRQNLFIPESQTTNHASHLLKDAINRVAQQNNRLSDVQFNHLPDCDVAMPQHFFLRVIEETFKNAITYSSAKSIIKINAHCTPGYLHVCVQDKGRGFSREELKQLGAYRQFNRTFFEQQGLGLGVHLSFLLLQKFGGTMHINSSPENGTEVCLTFPR